ncbi:beta-lactamase family protein [bacterium]|jgi:CubicO group peptidase (beta-lactamase class C family)|nr:beta-lactamase family protein [bacterium]MBT3580713.1 beta-lactamase family protein [bacterium]MBT4551784.1 beta-lactamase family protein [bacterium]MBT5988656.1 beta-lactamase family protein [bacterium]MBT7087944.1 beta-lactamase family protein [bacterium]
MRKIIAVRTIPTQIDTTLTQKIDTYLAPFLRRRVFSGCIMIIQAGNVVVSESFSSETSRFSSNTKFLIGSITKQFTATAIMQLQEKGKLSVKDPISKWMPGYPRGNEITIEHLLRHTSGIPNITDKSIFPDFDDTVESSLDELIANFRCCELEFNPGTQHKYSNSGYDLLTKIIETVSGRNYGTFLRESIFNPLGMKDTGVVTYDEHNLATGYTLIDEDIYPAVKARMSSVQGSGSLCSTASNLFLWDQELHRIMSNSDYAGILSREGLSEMFVPGEEPLFDNPKEESRYGYGWTVSKDGSEVWHDGMIPGFNSYFVRNLDEKTTVIILSNNDYACQTFDDITDIALGKEVALPELPQEKTRLTEGEYTECLGMYKVLTGGITYSLEVSKQDDCFYIQQNDNPKMHIRPEQGSNTRFFRLRSPEIFDFVLDADGNVTGFNWLPHNDFIKRVAE